MKTVTVFLTILFTSILAAQTRPSISPIEGTTSVDSRYDFGPRLHPILKVTKPHYGVDFPVQLGTDVHATASGTVLQANKIEGYGVVVKLKHADGFETFYAHLSGLAVKKGDRVKRGQTIAFSGNSGQNIGPHLHYEVLLNGKNVDPKDYFASK